MVVVVTVVIGVSVITMITLLPFLSWLVTLPLIFWLSWVPWLQGLPALIGYAYLQTPKFFFSPRTFPVLFCYWSAVRLPPDLQALIRPSSFLWVIGVWRVVELVIDRGQPNCLLCSPERNSPTDAKKLSRFTENSTAHVWGHKTLI
jgi:hypothetical protein